MSPISAGLAERCPSCGQGRVFRAYLKFKPACEACGQDFTKADTADGPAFFVGFFVLILFAPFGFIIPMADQPIWWKALMMIILVIITVAAAEVALGLGIVFAMYRNTESVDLVNATELRN